MSRCIVVGGGISGLAAAHALAERGIEPLVLEASPRAGGKIESVRDDGFLVESGPQGFSDREPLVMPLAEKLGIHPVDALPAAKRRAVAFGGRLVDVPLDPLSLLRTRLLSARGKLRLLGDLVLPRTTPSEESVAAFARRRVGQEAAERLFFPLVSGLYAGDAERISLQAAFPSLAEHGRVIGGILSARLRTFSGGMEELTRALAHSLSERLRLSAPVRRIARDPDGWRVTFEERGQINQVIAPSLVLALPAHAAAPLLHHLDARAAEAAAAIPYVPVMLAWVAYRERELPRPLDRYGFLTAPGEPGELLGAVFSSAAFPARAPSGTGLISARLGGARHPDINALEDDDVALLVHRELRTLIEARGEPTFFKTIRHTHALPQYTLGHAARLELLDAAEEANPGLYLIGAGYRGAGVPDCVRAGVRVAERISRLGGRASPARSPLAAAG